MPKTKNQAKNKSRFEVRGGVINEFEFAQNEGAMTEEEHQRFLQQQDERGAVAGAKKVSAKSGVKKGASKKGAAKKSSARR
jgi:hypothetical protein